MHTPSPISVLLLAADSGEGSLGDMLDPVLGELFEQEQIFFRACYLSDLEPSYLDFFHVVVLLRTPLPGHPLDDVAAFREKSPWLHRFVESGGGLMVMFTECYGKTVSTLNEFCQPWGLRLCFNRLVPKEGVSARRFERLLESVILPFRFVPDSVIGPPSDIFDLVTEGGHGTQQLTCLWDEGSPIQWEPVLRGGDLVRSQPYVGEYCNGSEREIEDPVVCSAAEVDAGRVIAFPGSAPFWLVNSHIWRFQGDLHNQQDGAGFEFFKRAFTWLAAPRMEILQSEGLIKRSQQAVDASLLTKPSHFSFRGVDEAAQARRRNASSQKVWHGRGPDTVEDLPKWAEGLRDQGYRAAFMYSTYQALDAETWRAAQEICQKLSTPELRIYPGYDLMDDEGVRTAVVSLGELPSHSMRYPNTTLLEDVFLPHPGSLSILRQVLDNRIPPQRYGGYNLIEWDPSDAWFDLYRKLVASKYFVSPVTFHASQASLVDTCVLVPEGCIALDMQRENRHGTYVSEGPVLEDFRLSGPGLIDDEWEGDWYGYLPGEQITLSLSLSSDAPLAEVIVYDGEQIFATFSPDQTSFVREICFPAWRDFCFHVAARDADGRSLYASFPLYTRNREFWGHVGSDQMNNYVNRLRPSGRGYQGVGDRLYDMFGFVTLGAGWGDYIRVAPAMEYSQFMPRQEVSFTLGSFCAHHPSSLLCFKNNWIYANDHRRTFSFCGADAQNFQSEVVGQHLENEGGLVQRVHGEDVTPTRIFLPIENAQMHDIYRVWSWEEGEPIFIELQKSFSVDPAYVQEEWLTVASNAHYLIPDLKVWTSSRPGEGVVASEIPVQPGLPVPHKDWDNTHYLRDANLQETVLLEVVEGDAVEIGHGGIGTFALLPLGRPRPVRCLLLSDGREMKVFFQIRLTPKERETGQFLIDYLVAVGADENGASPVSPSLLSVLNRTGVANSELAFSVRLDVADIALPGTVDVDQLFPEWVGERLHLCLINVPEGTVQWRDEHGSLVFASQAQRGESFHIIRKDMPRVYHLKVEEFPV